MAVVADTDRPQLFDPAPRRAPGGRRALPTPAPRRPPVVTAERERTLEDMITGTWGGLRLTGSAACPLCGGELAARYGAGAHPVGGRCRSCATELG